MKMRAGRTQAVMKDMTQRRDCKSWQGICVRMSTKEQRLKELLKVITSDGHGHGDGVKLNTEEDRTGGWRTVFVGG